MRSDRAPASGPLDLALVIPAYNEQNRSPRTLDRLAGMARDSGLCIHIVVVDDGSEDGTAACVRARQQHFSSTPLSLALTHIRHRGKGAAVRAGMRKVSAPVVGYCDADLSAGPDAQGVPVPPGDHVVELTYRDPSIGWGVAGSLVSIGVLLAAALAVALATRRSVG